MRSRRYSSHTEREWTPVWIWFHTIGYQSRSIRHRRLRRKKESRYAWDLVRVQLQRKRRSSKIFVSKRHMHVHPFSCVLRKARISSWKEPEGVHRRDRLQHSARSGSRSLESTSGEEGDLRRARMSCRGCERFEASTFHNQHDLDDGTPVLQANEKPSFVVFSGGTAFNGVAEYFSSYTTRVSHVLPVSDDGGSTAEIVRVLGGPAVGDIRSRCLRLSDTGNAEARAVRSLLAHRLPEEDENTSKYEWYSIVEGTHHLWDGISDPYKHTIRAFLVHFHAQILRHSSEQFRFSNGSIGNFFFAGARTFFRSMEAAIFMYARVSGIPSESFVLPAIRGEDRIALGAELRDGSIIRGQNAISHPPEMGNISPGRHSRVCKQGSSPLPSPISRILYLSTEGDHLMHEVFPAVNPIVVQQVQGTDAIIYGMGSLYTSICPSLILRGVGEAVAQCHGIPKVLLLNGSLDRETEGMDAVDFVHAITDALNRRGEGRLSSPLRHPPSAYITTLFHPRGGSVNVDLDRLIELGIHEVREVDSTLDTVGHCIFCPESLVSALQQLVEESRFKKHTTPLGVIPE